MSTLRDDCDDFWDDLDEDMIDTVTISRGGAAVKTGVTAFDAGEMRRAQGGKPDLMPGTKVWRLRASTMAAVILLAGDTITVTASTTAAKVGTAWTVSQSCSLLVRETTWRGECVLEGTLA